jgi:spore germination protein KB
VKNMSLSGNQLFWMIFTMQTGMCLLLSITPTISHAHQDAWISVLVAGLGSLIITWITVTLCMRYPNLTLIEFSRTILGKWLGSLIVIPYLIKWYSILGAILRQSSDFLHLMLFDRTPFWVLILMTVILLIYVTITRGVETIARCAEVIGPLLIITVLIIFILSFKYMDWHKLLPVMVDNKPIDIFKGSLPPMSFFAESTILTMLIAFMTKPNASMSKALRGSIVAFMMIWIITISVVISFAQLAAGMRYPFFVMTGFISTMEFIQNIDAYVVIIWFFSVFIKLALYVFAASYGTAQWLGIKNWRAVIWFVVLVGFVIAVSFKNVDQSSIDYPTMYRIPFDFPITAIAIPALLLVVSLFRKKTAKEGG